MKSEYEKDRERLTPREREEVWGRILQRTGERRVRFLPRWALATAGACAVVALLFLLHPMHTAKEGPGIGRPEILAENKSADQAALPTPPSEPTATREVEDARSAMPDAGKMKTAAPGGVISRVVTSATPAGPSRDAAAPSARATPPAPAAASAPTAALAPIESPVPTADRTAPTSARPAPTSAPEPSTPARDLAESRSEARGLFASKKALEKGDITGTVHDSTGKPIPYANVIVVGTSWGAIADDAGRFTIRDVPAGTYTLKATRVGYADRSIDVHVEGDVAGGVEIILPLKDASLGLVEITATREGLHKMSAELRQDASVAPPNAVPDAIGSKGGVVMQRRELQTLGDARKQAILPPPPVYPTTGGSTLPNDEPYDSMYFEHYGVNPFIPTDEDPLSTFAVDVDAASYTVARRYVELGHLPPKDAVRVEEFVNYFRQDYPDFHDTDFRIFLEGAPSPFGKGYYLLRVGLRARTVEDFDRRPANLVFVIDHSGSMARENRLELVKQALHILVDRLNSDDRIGIVTYDTNGQILLDPTSLEDHRGRDRILDAIDRLQPGGSTNAAEGLTLGYEMAGRIFRRDAINRIILCTDGVANEGVTGAESILGQARREADRGIELTAIGFGMGNYNDVLLEKLADKGDGNYYYVDRLDEARRIFIENLTGTMQTVAKDAKIQVAFDPRRVLRYRLLGFENRDVADRDFRNDRVDAGEVGAGHEVTALYEVKLTQEASRGSIATVRIRYTRPDPDGEEGRDVREIRSTLDARDLSRSFDRASPRFQLDAAVAEFAEILRRSFWAKESRISDVVPLARRVAHEIPEDPDIREFAEIVERAADLSDKLSPEEQGERQRYDMPWSIEKHQGESRPGAKPRGGEPGTEEPRKEEARPGR